MDNIDDKKPSKGINSNKDCNIKIKGKNRGKKRKRESSESSSEYEDVLPDNTLEMEKNLHASAMKNNLDDISVRKILKKVVTNDHVLALVKLREEEEAENSSPEETGLQPKLTRSKAKELMKVSPKAATWNLELTPIKHIPVKTRPEVKALIAQELPEDEDDEEYEPTHEDVPSDDDQGLESCSDLDSQPRTPATPRSLQSSSPMVVKDGPFKVPQDISTPSRRKLDLEEEATIALRTRSKLSLSATSIEHIESTFVPPDDIPMPAVDDLWNEFLNECLNPASTSREGRNEDDDETDPEYNVAADADAHDEDEEALSNSIIKISKKELNDLVTELFNVMPDATEEALMTENISNSVLTDHSQTETSRRWEGKQEPISDEEGGNRSRLSDRITFEEERKKICPKVSIGKSDPAESDEEAKTKPLPKKKTYKAKSKPETEKMKTLALELTEPPEQRAPPLLQQRLKKAPRNECLLIEVEKGVQLLPEQLLILQQQLRQHVQLAASNYLQLYVHPQHWKFAPTYKEYLETFMKLVEKNPQSVVNVCNLQPAVELMASWEKSVSANTPENTEMLDFIQKEMERNARRMTNKALYVGDFHETFMKTIANSNVFLYPYLLPAMPYRGETNRRMCYLNSEDELITLGLDQFSAYVANNPSIYKLRQKSHPRHRWCLRVTVELVVKHMFPWMSTFSLHNHIRSVRKLRCKDNPIYKYFEDNEVNTVQHTLLPFNPQLSLYEQPEHELPRVWLRYLAKTSKRFRNYLMKRTKTTGVAPIGVELSAGPVIQKTPLPIDFTKPIPSHNKPPNSTPQLTNLEVIITTASSLPTHPNQYNLETSTGALIPVASITLTVDSNTAPIPTPIVATPTKIPKLPETTKTVQNSEHCTCCVLLRKICRQRQSLITEFFGNKRTERCECKEKTYPMVSNRLKLFINSYKDNYKCLLQSLEIQIKIIEEDKDMRLNEVYNNCDNNLDDLSYVTSFNLKLLSRLTTSKDINLKRRVYTVLHKFNILEHDPLQLASNLDKVFGIELADLYKEFMSLLTPYQADKLGAFKDYFLRNCVADLVKRVDEEVSDGKKRMSILEELHKVFFKNLWTACEICTDILKTLEDYPKLAQYVHSLFPHRKEIRCEPKLTAPVQQTSSDQGEQAEKDAAPCENFTVGDAPAEHEADQSMSEDEDSGGNISQPESNLLIKTETTIECVSSQQTRNNVDKVATVSKTEIEDHSSSSDSSMQIVLDDETVKSECPEWKRDEDKLILEVLKEQLTPEEREDKTIIEIIEEKNITLMISETLTHKSQSDIKSRLLYLLQLC